jgi:PBP1b-binding outer membrane lipoprotein LpoB
MITKINITKKKRRILGLVILGILTVFLAGCSEQQTTASTQVTNDNAQSKQPEAPQEIPKNQGNFSPEDKQMPPQDGNFAPGTRPNLPPEGNFSPLDRQMPPDDGNFTPGKRPEFPRDGNFTPQDKK